MSEPTWEILGGGGTIGGPIDYVGDWAAGITYQPGQVVRYAGVDYLAVNPSLGQVPPVAPSFVPGMVSLYDQILTAPGNFDIQNISQAYAHLVLRASLRTVGAVANDQAQMRFNGDSAANYAYQFMRANGSSAANNEGLNQSAGWIGQPAGGNAPANAFDLSIVEIMDYASAIKHKASLATFGTRTSDVTAGYMAGVVSSYWRNIAAINRIQIFANANFAIGSRLSIYGVLAAGQAPPVTTLAPGGIGTNFPASPTNGELFTLVDSLTAPTYAWDFRYVASITDAYKWVFVGGGSASAEENTAAMTNGAAYTDLASGPTGPAITVPRAGIYEINFGARHEPAQQNGYDLYTAPKLGAAVAVDTDSVRGYSVGTGPNQQIVVSVARTLRKTLAASDLVKLVYRCGAGNQQISLRWLKIHPVRLS